MDKTSSDLLSSLKQPQRPYFYNVFKKYNNTAIAQRLGVNSGYWCNLKTGYKQPSKSLQAKIDALYNEIIQAESLAATINKEGADNE